MCVAVVAPALLAQTVTVRTVADTLHVEARGFSFIEGAVLARLKEGRSVRVDFELTVLAKPEGPVVKQAMQAFTLSFDLWEERLRRLAYGIARRGRFPTCAREMPRPGASRIVTMPVSSLGVGRGTPFWIRLAYRVQDPAAVTPRKQMERDIRFGR